MSFIHDFLPGEGISISLENGPLDITVLKYSGPDLCATIAVQENGAWEECSVGSENLKLRDEVVVFVNEKTHYQDHGKLVLGMKIPRQYNIACYHHGDFKLKDQRERQYHLFERVQKSPELTNQYLDRITGVCKTCMQRATAEKEL